MKSSENAMMSAPLARGLGARGAGAFQIAGDVADDRIELRHGNGQTVGGRLVHDGGLAPDGLSSLPAHSAATAGSGLALAWRSDFRRSASRKARSSDCSALSRGSQTVW